MNTRTHRTLLVIGLLMVVCGVYAADEGARRGPAPFSVHDLDGDGFVSREEFESFRARRQAERAAEGRRLRNVPRLMSFDEIDSDHDGFINEVEMLDAVQRHRHGRPAPAP